MRNRSLGLLLFLAALGLVLLGWGWQTEFLPFSRAADRQPNSAPTAPLVAISPPKVSAQRLMADVEALAFQRYTADDRARARSYITTALQSAGWTVQTQEFESGTNLYASRPGTDPQAGTMILAAHYDTVEPSPGADDNATGVATVLEAARLLGRQPTPRTLELVLFDREEEGLLGSTAFVEQLVSSEKFAGALVMDMVGYSCRSEGCQSYPPLLPVKPPTTKGNFLAVLGDQGHLPLINSFVQGNPQASAQANAQPSSSTRPLSLPPVLTLTIPTMGGLTPDVVRSDHAPFWRQGLGAVLITDTANFRNPNYHRSTDRLETLDPEFFVGSAQVIINALTALLTSQGNLASG